MSRPAVIFDGVSKKYRRGERHNSLRDAIPAFFRRKKPASQLSSHEFWALQDVSFEVQQGEALGIIGPNGAGKSTTLKLLTRILKPTIGRCEVHGRTGALIEVAAGFHPDLTGRENIFLQGAIMGMRRNDILSRLDSIVDFAGVDAFVDTPVKRYSSGMNARLGFAIAAHLNPDVLIIDEVLSVGDAAFQEKCVQRMLEFRSSGVSIVFVSHNLQAISQLCTQAIYLHRSVRSEGTPGDVVGFYTTSTLSEDDSPGQDISIIETRLLDSNGEIVTDPVPPHTPLTLRVTYAATARITDVVLGLLLHRSTDNTLVYDGNFTLEELGLQSLEAGQTVTVDFHLNAHLARGHYHFDVHVLYRPTQHFLARRRPAATLAITEHRTHAGVADLEPRAVLTIQAR